MILKILYVDEMGYDFNPFLEKGFDFWEKGFEIVRVKTNEEVEEQLLNNNDISLIVTRSDNNQRSMELFPFLWRMPNYLKSKWFNYSVSEPIHNHYDPHNVGYTLVSFWVANNNPKDYEFFSIITPVYHTRRDVFERTYNSLLNQSYINWEWVLIDDSTDLSKTEHIRSIAKKDIRIKYYNLGRSGIIGDVKKKGFSLATGRYLLELDHDDVLLPNALLNCKKAFDSFPDGGFVWSNCAEVEINKYNEVVGFRNYARDENNNPTKNGWGFGGFGSAETIEWEGKTIWSNISPAQNPQTVRSITTLPNHFRCWRKEVYDKIGGHNPSVHVCDDLDIMIRTFLETKFIHLNSTEYIQFYEVDGNVNTQYARNREIQRLNHFIPKRYDLDIHNRFLELGVQDYCWNEEQQMSFYWYSFPGVEVQNVNYEYHL